MKDILNLQSEIALAISTALETELTPREEERLSRDREIDPEAFEEYLLGLHYHGLATAESTQKAIEHYKRALAIEPEFAKVHVMVAEAYQLNQQMAELPVSTITELVRNHVRTAMEIDPELADSHMAMAEFSWNFDWDLPTAGIQFARARELDPKLSMMGYAQYLNVVGRHQDALREALIAARQNPLDPFIQANLASRYNNAGQPEAALAEIASLNEREPDFWIGLWVMGLVHLYNGNPVDAVEPLRKSIVNSGGALAVKPLYVYALILAGRKEEAKAIQEEIEKQAEEDYVSPFYLGQLYAAFGRNDEAFAAFDRAVEERDWLMFWISPELTPITRGLVSDPRWPELLRKIGLPES